MYKFLRYRNYKTYTAPELDESGAIVRSADGSPKYISVNRKECYRIAAIMSGDQPYRLPWLYDIEAGFLFLLDPDDPKSKTIANGSADNFKGFHGLLAVDAQCVLFGTGKCDKEFDICYSCPYYCTEKCRDCKKRCEQCGKKVRRVVSYESVVQNGEDEDMPNELEPVDPTDVAQETEDKAALDALQKAVDALDETDRTIIATLYNNEGTFREAQEECGFKSVNSVQKRHAKALKTLAENEDLKKFFD